MIGIKWFEIYATNWHRLTENDIRSWQWQIQNAIPDLVEGEILAAMQVLADQPDMGDHRKAPRPRDIAGQIRTTRARVNQNKDHSRQSTDSVPYSEHLADVMHLAASGDWYGVAEYCAQSNSQHPCGSISSDVVDSLWIDVQRKYPKAVYCWPDNNCAAYERVAGKTCPYWGPGRVHIKRDLSKAGPLARIVGDLPCKTGMSIP